MRPLLSKFRKSLAPHFADKLPDLSVSGERIAMSWFCGTPVDFIQDILDEYPLARISLYSSHAKDYKTGLWYQRLWLDFITGPDDHKFDRRGRLAAPILKDEKGKNLCRGCGGPITAKRRQTWCSDECVSEHVPHMMNRKVWKRDRGRCQICGIHCGALEALMRAVRHKPELLDKLMSAIPWITGKYMTNFYQFDHIVPVIEGGGALGTANLRVLCTGCHKQETKALAARRAALRRTR